MLQSAGGGDTHGHPIIHRLARRSGERVARLTLRIMLVGGHDHARVETAGQRNANFAARFIVTRQSFFKRRAELRLIIRRGKFWQRLPGGRGKIGFTADAAILKSPARAAGQ